YFGSQPWPFPNSLMIGFLAEWSSGELRIGDPNEIEDAGWFSADAMPYMPPKVSIARAMIDAFLSGRESVKLR
ncbi:MAG: NAD(+) diphosphatase, partial [Rubrobacteraceae bacterium]